MGSWGGGELGGQMGGQEATSLQIIFLGLFGGQRLKLLGEGRAGAL